MLMIAMPPAVKMATVWVAVDVAIVVVIAPGIVNLAVFMIAVPAAIEMPAVWVAVHVAMVMAVPVISVDILSVVCNLIIGRRHRWQRRGLGCCGEREHDACAHQR